MPQTQLRVKRILANPLVLVCVCTLLAFLIARFSPRASQVFAQEKDLASCKMPNEAIAPSMPNQVATPAPSTLPKKKKGKTKPKQTSDRVQTQNASQPSIGMATMKLDGTLILDLRAQDANRAVGDSRLVYPPNHKDYKEILKHLGGLCPGESKPVPPWPENR